MTLGEQKNMKWKLAVLKVLQEANKPLHYQEILRAIKERQLRPITGKTPERTVYVNLLDLQDGGRVKRTDPGVFDIVLHSDNDEESPPAEEERPESPIVRFPHGRYWRVDSVDWSKGPQKGRLLGQLRGADPISNSVRDFANDPGLYVLHHTHAPMGILYVGMTEKSLYARLKSHLGDQCESRWDSFSWFSVLGMTEEELEPTDRFELDRNLFLRLMEAFMLECFMPPLNEQRTGKNTLFLSYEQYRYRC